MCCQVDRAGVTMADLDEESRGGGKKVTVQSSLRSLSLKGKESKCAIGVLEDKHTCFCCFECFYVLMGMIQLLLSSGFGFLGEGIVVLVLLLFMNEVRIS